MASPQPFQARQLSPEQQAKLEKAEKKIDDLKVKLEKWANEVENSPIGSEELQNAKERRDFYNQERDKAQLQLKELKVEFGQVRFLKQSLASLSDKFQQNGYRRNEELSFCKPANFEGIVENLTRLTAPGSARMLVPLLVGASGIGKTRTALEASFEVISKGKGNFTGVFARVFVNMIPKNHESIANAGKILAKLLANEFLQRPLNDDYDVNLVDILQKLQDDLHATLLIVHIDEYQYDVTLSQHLVSLVVWLNRDNSLGFRCIPIVSGVPKVRLEKDLDVTSSWQPNYHIMQPVPGLSRMVYTRLKLPENVSDPAMDSLLRACGGYPFLIWELVRIFEENANLMEFLISGSFGPITAAKVWDSLIRGVQWRFQRRLWLDVLTLGSSESQMQNTKGGAMDQRRSTQIKDAIVRRLLKLSIAELPVSEDAQILPDTALTFRQAAILFDLVPCHPSGFVVFFPSVVAYILNEEFKVLPGDLLRSNPFSADPIKFETVATIALANRFAARNANEEIPLTELRPGAKIYVGDEALRSMKLIVPRDIHYVDLVNDLADEKPGSPSLSNEPGKIWDGTVRQGNFFAAATDQTALNSFALVDGVLNPEESPVPVEIISHYKMLLLDEPCPDARSKSQLDDSDLVTIIKAMQEKEGSVADKLLLANKRRIVVYDILASELNGKEQDTTGYPNLLKSNEVLLVSNHLNVEEALGPVLGVREGISKRARIE